MISRIERFFRRLRKWLSRAEYSVRLLGLPKDEGDPTAPGLIIIQVDGLALSQLHAAFDRGRMPFLRDLTTQRDHRLVPFYSGIPSTTPAVQAELFFGEKTAVPAFEYIRRRTGERTMMFDARAAESVARAASSPDEPPLLAGGTAYSDIFTGGADEARYCVETLRLDNVLKAVNPIKAIPVLIIHIGKVFRVAGLTAIELGLAVIDCIRGVYDRKNIFQELKFIPSRVGVTIVLRELIRFRVKMDVARGVPVIHANLVAYDEHAHRRGPDAAFAHWCLSGIDGTIRDIYRTAMRSDCRDYRMIIYSDHGQERVVSYRVRHRKGVGEAVREVLAKSALAEIPVSVETAAHGREHLRRRTRGLIGSNRPRKRPLPISAEKVDRIRIADMGPVAHVYIPVATDSREKERIARDLVEEARIPLVLFTARSRTLAVNSAGIFDLQRRPEAVLGEDHPFLKDAGEDLARLCRHPDSGDLVLSGWAPGQPPLSFPLENGAHGGPGTEETRGFALLPPGTHEDTPFLRPLDLREAALALLGRSPSPRPARPRSDGGRQPPLRVLTYNIHACMGMDGKTSPARTARVIGALTPDVVALQEVDAGRFRTSGVHQARHLGEALEMDHRFFPLIESKDGQYGLAVLSRFPIRRERFAVLPGPFGRGREQRGAMWVTVETPDGPVHLFNTHLSLYRRERMAQIEALLGPAWVADVPEGEPVILCADLNAGPRSPVYRRLAGRLRDVQTSVPGVTPRATFFSRSPILRLDHIFVSDPLAPVAVQIPAGQEVRLTSDHLPLAAELRWAVG